MSDGDWRINPLAGALTGVALLLFAGPLLKQVGQPECAYSGTSEQTSRAQQGTEISSRPCASIQRPQAESTPSRNEWREEEDLRTQRDMSRWALLMLIVTTIGVVYVARTLHEARRTNEGFAKASEQQLTAYVIAEAFELHVTHIDNGNKGLNWSFALRNAGQTPAFDLSHDWKVDWATAADAASWSFDLPDKGGVLGPDRTQNCSGRLCEPGTDNPVISAIEIAVLSAMKSTMWVKGAATYRDINGRKWRHDYCWELIDPNRSICLLLPRPVNHTLHLVPSAAGNSLQMIEDPNEKK